MYDIDKDVENVARAIEELAVICPSYTMEIARAAVNASSAAQQLKELQHRYNAQDSLLALVLETNKAMCKRIEELQDSYDNQAICLDDSQDYIGDLQHQVALAKDGIEELQEHNAELSKQLQVRAKQIGIACMKHDLTHSLTCGRCYKELQEKGIILINWIEAFQPKCETRQGSYLCLIEEYKDFKEALTPPKKD